MAEIAVDVFESVRGFFYTIFMLMFWGMNESRLGADVFRV